MSDKFPIPVAALHPARIEWRKPDTPGVFEAVITNNPERRDDPSYYVYHRDTKAEDLNEFVIFTYGEALACAEAGVFRTFARVAPNKYVSVNEHALHAYEDFCRDVSEAWRCYQAKLDRIPPKKTFAEEDLDDE